MPSQSKTSTGHEALRESERRLRLAVQAGRMYIYEWNAATDTVVRSAEFGDVLGTDQPGETSREWGRTIEMTPAVKARVDQIWQELGL